EDPSAALPGLAMLAASSFSKEQEGDPACQLRADSARQGTGSGPMVEISYQVSSGSSPITYNLVGKGGHVYMQQRPLHGQPANFILLARHRAGSSARLKMISVSSAVPSHWCTQ
ncbi:protein IL-40 precursor, partial [Daubentonia madagascariensis]